MGRIICQCHPATYALSPAPQAHTIRKNQAQSLGLGFFFVFHCCYIENIYLVVGIWSEVCSEYHVAYIVGLIPPTFTVENIKDVGSFQSVLILCFISY